MRQYHWVDHLIFGVDRLLNPFKTWQERSASLMRVNHSGEICAQALYQGQALMARDQKLAEQLKEAAKEEEAHLEWCAKRLQELGSHPSVLAPLWASSSFVIGALAGLAGDKISLGFLAETEFQVSQHLENHLKKLPSQDSESRTILIKMQEDELRHATTALGSGGVQPPHPIRWLMAGTAKIMTVTSQFI